MMTFFWSFILFSLMTLTLLPSHSKNSCMWNQLKLFLIGMILHSQSVVRETFTIVYYCYSIPYCIPLAKRNGQFSIYLPFLIHFSLIFHLLTIYFHFFWSQLSQTIYWNHLLAIHTEKCFKMAISFHWFIIYLKNGIETELPLPSSPFFFHFFSRPFFPLKWLFEEAWSTV